MGVDAAHYFLYEVVGVDAVCSSRGLSQACCSLLILGVVAGMLYEVVGNFLLWVDV